VTAHPKHGGHRRHDQQHHQGDQQRPLTDALHGHRKRALDPAGKRPLVLRLVIERLHHLDVAQGLAGIAAHFGKRVLAAPGKLPHAPAEQDHRRHHERHAGDDDQRQLGVGDEQQHQATDEHERVAQRDGHRRADHGLQERGVGGDARLDLGGLIGLEERRVQPDQVVEHGQADVGADPLADPGHEVEAQKRAQGQHHHQQCEQADGLHQHVRRAGSETFIDHQAHALADGQGDAGRDDQSDAGEHHLTNIRAQKSQCRSEAAEAARWGSVEAFVHGGGLSHGVGGM
jgi:hypothetical protein